METSENLTEKTRSNFQEMHRLLAELRNHPVDPERIGLWMDEAYCLAVCVASGDTLDINPDLQDERYFNAWLVWHAMDMCNLLPETPPCLDYKLAKLKRLPVPEQPIARYAPKYYFTFDVFSNRIPGFAQILERFAGRADVRFLEIGSFEGMSACWFLDHVLTHPTSGLTCIDMLYHELFDRNIHATGQEHRVRKMVGFSKQVLPSLPTYHYDFIYVDGDHDTDVVFQDGELSWPRLKRDGIILFDDYLYQPDFMNADPRAGVDAFLATISGEYRIVHRGYQLAVQRL
jgi:hypothetical protein